MFAQLEVHYANGTDENPRWIQLMYCDTPDVGKVTEAYQNNTKYIHLLKTSTQYYKRWLRSISRTTALPSKEYKNNF